MVRGLSLAPTEERSRKTSFRGLGFVVLVIGTAGLCSCGEFDAEGDPNGADETDAEALQNASPESGFPSVAQIWYGGRFICSANIIAEKTALTAAHCVYGKHERGLPVSSLWGTGNLGTGHVAAWQGRADDFTQRELDECLRQTRNNWSECTARHVRALEKFKTWEVRVGGGKYRGYAVHHPSYGGGSDMSYDIAIIRLDQKVPVHPTRVNNAHSGGVKDNWPVQMVGFGDTQSVHVPGMKRSGYSRIWSVVNSREMILATRVFPTDPAGAVACPGDSGGPTFVGNGAAAGVGLNRHCQIGVHSRASCTPGGTTTEIRTDAFFNWIRNNKEPSFGGHNDMVQCNAKNRLGRPLYRWYNPNSTDWFYSLGANPANWSHPGFTYHGVGAYVMPDATGGALPLHRFYAPAPRSTHLYSGRAAAAPGGSEYNYLISLGFRYEGIEGYVFPTPKPMMVPLYRLSWWNAAASDGAHFMTTDIAERDHYLRHGWGLDRIEGYVYAPVYGL